MMKHSLPLLLVMLLAVACKPTVPSRYIQPDDMEDLLYDYHLGQAVGKVENTGHDSYERNRLFLAVLRKHKVSEADFDSSLVYYYSHVDRLKAIYSRVNDRLHADAKGLGADVVELNRYSQYSATGDTANIWKHAAEALLLPRPTMNRLDFTIRADSTFRVGDSFMLQFLSEYIWQGGNKDATVCVVSRYEGDSTVQTVGHVALTGLTQVRIPANNQRRLKEMQGFVYLSRDAADGDLRQLMFISQIQLIRFHPKETPIAHDETANTDSVATDSVPRGADDRRPTADTARALPVGRGLRSKSAPFRRGGGAH